MKCDACGIESDLEKAFTKIHRSLHRSNLTLCPRCSVRRHRVEQGWYQIIVIVGGMVGYFLLWSDTWWPLGRFLTSLFLINLFLILAIIPHELGHFIAGRLVGWRVFAVSVGMGKRAFKFDRFGTIFSFHWLPVGGLTRLSAMDDRWYRVKFFITLIAGVAMNAAVAGAILCLWWHPWHEYGFYWGFPRAARLCFLANLFVVVFNLIPRKTKGPSKGTDGYQILKLFTKKKKSLEKIQATRFALEAVMRRSEYNDTEGAMDWCNKGLTLFPKDFRLLNIYGVLCSDRQDYRRAREIYLQLLSSEVKKDQNHYLFINNIAYVDALIGDPELLAEADTYSKEAYVHAPWVPSFTGTRGTVLVEMKQFEEGIKLLQEAFEKHEEIFGKALNACHLAIAYSRMGSRTQADKYLQLARQIDPKSTLIGRAEMEIARAA